MVPYIDEYVEDPQRRVPNDKDIWPNIEEDFSLLPEFYRIIRVSLKTYENAAKAFLAKAYLFQQKYSEAKFY